MIAKTKLALVSFFLGCLALLTVAVLGYAHANNDGVTGWLTARAGDVISLFPRSESVEKGFSSVGMFAIYEGNLRILLIAMSVIFTVTGLVFAYLSAVKERASLWYAAGVLLAGTALSILHVGAGVVAMVVTTVLIISARNGMTRT